MVILKTVLKIILFLTKVLIVFIFILSLIVFAEYSIIFKCIIFCIRSFENKNSALHNVDIVLLSDG